MNKKRELLWLFFFGPAVISACIILLFLICVGQGLVIGIKDFFGYQAKPNPKKVIAVIAGGILQITVIICLL